MTHKTREISAEVEKVINVDSETGLELLIKILPPAHVYVIHPIELGAPT